MVHKTEENGSDLFTTLEKEKSQIFERKQALYKDLSKKFTNTRSDYTKQFSHIYSARLIELRNVLIPRVQAKWSTSIKISFLFVNIAYLTRVICSRNKNDTKFFFYE